MGWKDAPHVGGAAWQRAPKVSKGAADPFATKADVGDLFAHNYTAGLDVPASGLGEVLSNALIAPFSSKVDFNPGAAFQRGSQGRTDRLAAARKAHPIADIPAEIAGAVTSAPGRVGSALIERLAAARGGIGSFTSAASDIASRAGPLARSTADALGFGGVYGASTGQGAAKGGAEAAAGNIVGNALFRGAGRVVSPVLSRTTEKLAAQGKALKPNQEAVRTLHAIGTKLTPGEIGGGAIKKVEDAMSTVPFIGSPQRTGQRRALESYNLSAINGAISPVGSLPKGTKPGREAIAKAQKMVSDAYDNALNAMSSPLDGQFHTDLAGAQAAADVLPDDLKQTYDTIIRQHVNPFVGPEIEGRNLQAIKRQMDEEIAGYESGNQREKLLVAPLKKARDAFMENAKRNVPGRYAAYRKADQAFRNMAPINVAAAANKTDGVITPFQHAGGVARRGYGTTTNVLARGAANGQDISNAATMVLPPSMPSSGTAERGAILGLLGSGAFAAPFAPKLALSGAALSAPYAPGVRDLYQAYRLARRPQVIENLADRLKLAAPYGGAVLAPLAIRQGE